MEFNSVIAYKCLVKKIKYTNRDIINSLVWLTKWYWAHYGLLNPLICGNSSHQIAVRENTKLVIENRFMLTIL